MTCEAGYNSYLPSMKQSNVIKFALVGLPLGMFFFGVIALSYSFFSPASRVRDGSRTLLNSKVSVTEKDLKAWVARQVNDIGPRPSIDQKKTRITAKWIESELSEENIGYRPKVTFLDGKSGNYRNIEVELPGTDKVNEIIIVGTCYSSAADSPGANCNGTGVAALLATARYFVSTEHSKTIRFVACVGTFRTGEGIQGSGISFLAESSKKINEQIIGMIYLDSLGYYTDQIDDQRVPLQLKKEYQGKGNYLALVGELSSEEFIESFYSKFSEEYEMPVRKIVISRDLLDYQSENFVSLTGQGYPVLQLSDNSIYRYPHYQKGTDTPDKIDYERLSGVVKSLTTTIELMVSP